MEEVLKRVGRYDLLEVIGRGGAAVVYLARQRDLQRPVALKELAPYQAADTSFAGRFVEESRLAGQMNHANVVTVHEYFVEAEVPYIAMEFLPNGSLRTYIGELSLAQIAGVLEGVLAGLSHGEEHGVVHRDLKPENLLVTADGRVKIADFGVARAYNQAQTRAVVTMAGTTIGTPTYMSPEQALGNELTASTDLYSLGVVAWELLTGRVPFEDQDNPVAVLYRHVHEPVPPARDFVPDLDPRIDAWLTRMLAKAPEERFQSAEEAWFELEEVVLELIGPRWRREARLAVGEDHSRRDDATLTPAEFRSLIEPADGDGDDDAPDTQTPAPADPAPGPARTEDGLPTAAAADVTVAPQPRPRRHTTMFRIARRHHDGPDPGGSEDTPGHWRAAMIAIGLAMIGAAALGFVLSSSGHPAPRPRTTTTQSSTTPSGPTTAEILAADTKLARIAERVGVSRTRLLVAYNSFGKTPAKQAQYATEISRLYAGGATQVTRYGAQTPHAKPLAAQFHTLSRDYAQIADAARRYRPTAYNKANQAVARDEHALQRLVTRL
ncbi:MAG TPA: serine/threonine-protein kinase [Solirubrobacteraceae bacterium]|nr:serine/threonine-protein kinase [Solirubrobacteraceae bacterium]